MGLMHVTVRLTATVSPDGVYEADSLFDTGATHSLSGR